MTWKQRLGAGAIWIVLLTAAWWTLTGRAHAQQQSICTPLYSSTGVRSCIPVGQTSPTIVAPNPLPVGGIANAVAPTLTEGRAGYLSFDLNGLLRTSASVSASISGFAPGGAFATLTASASSGSVALPAGAVVIFQNVGTTAVSCTLGVGSATAVASQNIVQPASWLALTVGANTFGACIDQTGSASNTVVLTGGAGLPTGAGGGGGSGGGGGAVTVADGADSTQGAIADAASTAGGTGTLSAKLRLMTTQLGTINTTLGSPFQAGGSIGNTTFAATQGTAANLNATVVGTGTFAMQLTGATNNINNIAGTVSLPTGAGTSANQTAIQAPVAAGAATATKSVLLGGQFDTTQKTLTNGQQATLSVSPRGAVFVAPGAENFAVQAAITAASGSIASGAVASGAFASGALASGSVASGAMVDLGAQADAAWVSGSGSAISILKTISGNTGAAIPAGSALIGNVGLAQASATSGQSGPLVQCAVTTAAPTYTTAQTDPCSMTTAGGLRVDNSTIVGNAISTGSGVMGTGTQRIAMATDSPGIITLGTNTAANSVPVVLNTTPTIANGSGVVLAPSAETLAALTPIVSTALESNKVIKASAGNFYSGYVTTGAVAGWLLLANSTTAPTAGGAAIAPLACVVAPANASTSIGGLTPMRLSTGITLVFSTSGCLTNTASTTAFFSGMAN